MTRQRSTQPRKTDASSLSMISDKKLPVSNSAIIPYATTLRLFGSTDSTAVGIKKLVSNLNGAGHCHFLLILCVIFFKGGQTAPAAIRSALVGVISVFGHLRDQRVSKRVCFIDPGVSGRCKVCFGMPVYRKECKAFCLNA
jgi:hypothetical protein